MLAVKKKKTNGPVVILDELTNFKASHQLSACNFLRAVLQEEGLQLSLGFSTQQTQRDGAISTDLFRLPHLNLSPYLWLMSAMFNNHLPYHMYTHTQGTGSRIHQPQNVCVIRWRNSDIKVENSLSWDGIKPKEFCMVWRRVKFSVVTRVLLMSSFLGKSRQNPSKVWSRCIKLLTDALCAFFSDMFDLFLLLKLKHLLKRIWFIKSEDFPALKA